MVVDRCGQRIHAVDHLVGGGRPAALADLRDLIDQTGLPGLRARQRLRDRRAGRERQPRLAVGAPVQREPGPGPRAELDDGVALDEIEHDHRILHHAADRGGLLRLVPQRDELVVAGAYDVEAPARRLAQHDELDADLVVAGGGILLDEVALRQCLQVAINGGLGRGEFLRDGAERGGMAAMREVLEDAQRQREGARTGTPPRGGVGARGRSRGRLRSAVIHPWSFRLWRLRFI